MQLAPYRLFHSSALTVAFHCAGSDTYCVYDPSSLYALQPRFLVKGELLVNQKFQSQRKIAQQKSLPFILVPLVIMAVTHMILTSRC